MIIFKDKLTNDEFFTDSSKYKVIDDCIYEIECKLEKRKEGQIVLAGSNPSAEDAAEEFDDSVQIGLDVVLNHQLVETSFSDKKDYKVYLKGYSKALNKHWTDSEKLKPEELEKQKESMTNGVKYLLANFDNYQFFMGQSTDPDGLVAHVDYKDTPSGQVPYMYILKAGVDEEKV